MIIINQFEEEDRSKIGTKVGREETWPVSNLVKDDDDDDDW